MPNWCENYLGVAGTLPRVKQFMEAAQGEQQCISFQQLHPASMDEAQADGAQPQWYLDRMKKWGVLRDASLCGDPLTNSPSLKTAGNSDVDEEDEDIEEDDEVVAIYYFDTPWGPPEVLFDKVSQDYPDLKFRLRWVTEGPDEKGISEWVGGVKAREESSAWEALDCVDWF
jgi:hypothetical protein